jgi:hypothetical protein
LVAEPGVMIYAWRVKGEAMQNTTDLAAPWMAPTPTLSGTLVGLNISRDR